MAALRQPDNAASDRLEQPGLDKIASRPTGATADDGRLSAWDEEGSFGVRERELIRKRLGEVADMRFSACRDLAQ